MKFRLKFIAILICGTFLGTTGFAQPSPNNSVQMILRTPEKTYHVGQEVILKVEVKNNTDKVVGFAEGPQGIFAVQLYDLQDSSKPDILLPFRKKAMEQKTPSRSMVVELEVAPGKIRDFTIHLSTEAVITHAGSYKVIVSTRVVS